MLRNLGLGAIDQKQKIKIKIHVFRASNVKTQLENRLVVTDLKSLVVYGLSPSSALRIVGSVSQPRCESCSIISECKRTKTGSYTMNPRQLYSEFCLDLHEIQINKTIQ